MRTPRLYQKRTTNRGGLPDDNRLARRLAAVLVFVCVAPATASATVADPAPARSQTSSVSDTLAQSDPWEDILRWYLLWIYQNLGGDPNLLVHQPVVECMGGVVDYYTKHGIPTGLEDSQRGDFRLVIEGLLAHLANAPQGLVSPQNIQSLIIALQMMYADVGGDPDTLP